MIFRNARASFTEVIFECPSNGFLDQVSKSGQAFYKSVLSKHSISIGRVKGSSF